MIPAQRFNLGPNRSTRSIIIDSLEKDASGGANNACVYVYFSNSEDSGLNFGDIFISLTLQLIHHHVDSANSSMDSLKKMYNNRRYGKVFHTGHDYLDMFASQAAAFDHVFLVFDALDNCEDSANERTQELLHKAIIKQLPTNVKILATSRSSPSSLWRRGGTNVLSIKADPADLAAYVHDRIETHGHMESLINEHPDANFKMTVIQKVIQATSDM